jgi:flagella basal body P-ring formation protein FlgA
MSKALAIIFAYMLSVSSAFASPVAEVESLLAKYIASEKGLAPAKIGVQITKGKQVIATAKASNISLLALSINESTHDFYALISIGGAQSQEISGKYSNLSPLPVLSRNMNKGEVITESDVTIAYVSEKLAQRGFVNDISTLLGKATTRPIHKNLPIMPKQIAAPKIIEKDKNITMKLASNIIKLEDAGIALEAGGLGEYIRVKNANSNKIVKAKVIDANTVEVTPIGQQLAQN